MDHYTQFWHNLPLTQHLNYPSCFYSCNDFLILRFVLVLIVLGFIQDKFAGAAISAEAPRFPLSLHLFQFCRRNKEARPGLPRDIVPLVLGPQGLSPVGQARNIFRERDQAGMQKSFPSNLSWLHSMWRRNGSTQTFCQMTKLLTLIKGVPSHPVKNVHFSHLYPVFHSFGYDPDFMTLCECSNVDWPLNQQFCLTLNSLFTTSNIAALLYTSSFADPPINLPLYSPLTREHYPKILELLPLRQELFSNLLVFCHIFPVEESLTLVGADSHPDYFTFGSELPQCLM